MVIKLYQFHDLLNDINPIIKKLDKIWTCWKQIDYCSISCLMIVKTKQ